MRILKITMLLFVLLGCSPSMEAATPTQTQTPTMEPTPLPSPTATATEIPNIQFMNRPAEENLRVLNYNVLWDSIFPDGDPDNHPWRNTDKSQAFRRLLAAIQPDIACLQEINTLRDPADVSAIFDEVLPLLDGERWRAVKGTDNVIVSRFDLLLDGYQLKLSAEAAALVDLPDAIYGQTDLYMICAHFKSAGSLFDIATRQLEADLLISQVRDFKTAGGRIDLPLGTPFILLGDFNVYDTDPHYHLTTLLTGDIVNEDKYGADVNPDWDDTDLSDALPSHNGRGELFYTWRNDAEVFAPYPLDRIVYSDSVLLIANQFILNTMLLTVGELALLGLEADDVVINVEKGNYDHFPMVVDFVIVP